MVCFNNWTALLCFCRPLLPSRQSACLRKRDCWFQVPPLITVFVIFLSSASQVLFILFIQFLFGCRSQDPTTLNQQGNDFGTQYRSGLIRAISWNPWKTKISVHRVHRVYIFIYLLYISHDFTRLHVLMSTHAFHIFSHPFTLVLCVVVLSCQLNTSSDSSDSSDSTGIYYYTDRQRELAEATKDTSWHQLTQPSIHGFQSTATQHEHCHKQQQRCKISDIFDN